MRAGSLTYMAVLSFSLIAGEKPLTKTEQAARFHPVAATPSPDVRERAFAQRNKLLAESTLKAIPFRSVGPLGQGGRVVGLAADDRKPSAWVVAFATGGLWYTKNEGADWTSLFDHEGAFALGAIAVQWGEPGQPQTIWAGSGEANASRSSYGGAGIFKSTDGGKTWANSFRKTQPLPGWKSPM